MEEITEYSQTAQVIATIEFVPDTLYFTAPRNCWLNGKLLLCGVRIGESTCRDFTDDELRTLNEIVQRAVIRHHKSLKEYGNN